MAEQTVIQVRVDSELKEQVSEIYERIGIDIPTAVRMFFKATVREQDLPFTTKVAKQTSQAEQLMEYFKDMVMYEPPLADEDTIVILPLKNGYEIPASMYVQLVEKVPAGKVTCWDDIFATLGRFYGRTVTGFPERALPRIDTKSRPVPYWRVVTNRGILIDGRGGSKEGQRDALVKEGVPVVQRGNIEGSYKVVNFREYMFDFSTLKTIVKA